MRTGRPLRKRRRQAYQRTPRFVAPALLIDHRPEAADRRERIGDWEGDLITGCSSRSAIAMLVDRTSRYVRLFPPIDGHGAEAVRDGLIDLLYRLPEAARLTLTWDQGAEMACHHQSAPNLREGVFLAHPASPWQRGTNENTNGCCGSTSPSAPTCPSTPPTTFGLWKIDSTIGPGRPLVGKPPPRSSPPLWQR
ncbi:IS30 family transposase [Streptomyces decoyicus]|uniref:IS30 family transposase n=1 Tax=Streptomyces decoyicus TaxID=249567 RepID=UPI003C12B9BF